MGGGANLGGGGGGGGAGGVLLEGGKGLNRHAAITTGTDHGPAGIGIVVIAACRVGAGGTSPRPF